MRGFGSGAAQRVLEGARSGPHLHKSKRPISVGLANVAVWTSDDDNTFCRITAGGLGMGGGGIADAFCIVVHALSSIGGGMDEKPYGSKLHTRRSAGWVGKRVEKGRVESAGKHKGKPAQHAARSTL